MARQFKVEVEYLGPPTTKAEIYWHDNDTIEFITMPFGLGADNLIGRTRLLEDLIAYIKRSKATEVLVKKV